MLAETADDSGISVLVLSSTDPSCFSAGMDTVEALGPGSRTVDVLLELQWALETYPKPMIAVLRGHVIGGGAELAMSADIRIGCSLTTMRFPGTAYGIAQGSWHLVDAVGASWARQIVLTGRSIDAQECLHLGLLHEVVDDAESRGLSIALALAERSDAAMRAAKRLIREGASRPLRERFDDELRVNAKLMASGEVHQRLAHRERSSSV